MNQILSTKKLFLYIFLTSALFFSGCSGDNEDEMERKQPQEPEVSIGVFRDSEVAGLRYETETQSGTTNAAGEFNFLEGETVTFYVGDIKLGSSTASVEMTPISIASTANATIETPEVKNIAAFLQTLDFDGDPANGILIESAAAESIHLNAIDFTEPIIQILGEVVAQIYQTTGLELEPVYPEEAAAHLAETLDSTYEPSNMAFSNFIATIESWVTSNQPRTSVQWVHETDDSGRLTKSIRYEKRPYRPLAEYNYLNFNESGLPTEIELIVYSQGLPIRTTQRDIIFDADNNVSGIQDYSDDGKPTNTINFTNRDNSHRITEAIFYDKEGNFLFKENYLINENGNTYERTRYSTITGNGDTDISMKFSYEYTSFGEIAAMTVFNSNFGEESWEYIYREDKTLKERIRTSVDLHGRNRTDHYFYDEQEKRERLTITVGDYVSDYVDFYDNGNPKRAETYYQGFLYEIVEWNPDGSSVWTTIEENGSYKIEYKDANENILKTEYYDSEGNLLSTE